MVCIYCQSETKVKNSRPQKRLNNIWRRRTCQSCGSIFTTIEAVDHAGSVLVQNNKVLQPFQRDKLFMSVYDSLKHRKTALADATGLTNTIITTLHPLMASATIQSSDIAVLSITVLQRFDKVAATHYTAFHPLK